MKRTPFKNDLGNGLKVEKDGEKNRLVIWKQSDEQEFYLNIRNARSVQGMKFSKEELLHLAWEIENFVVHSGKHIVVRGYWKDEPEKIFEEECMIGDFGQISRVVEEEYLYLWFKDEANIVGEHQDYVILEYWFGTLKKTPRPRY